MSVIESGAGHGRSGQRTYWCSTGTSARTICHPFGLRGGIDLEQVLRQRLPLAKRALQALPGGGELMQISASRKAAKPGAYEEDRLVSEFQPADLDR